ncbi:hypothetical protein [Carbonactinospora thermoautotrophica]|nr:hypothetical protein [Carbonactinospora thermoautotrophica]
MPQDAVAPEGEPPKRAAELESLQQRRAARPGHRVGVAEEEDKDVE